MFSTGGLERTPAGPDVESREAGVPAPPMTGGEGARPSTSETVGARSQLNPETGTSSQQTVRVIVTGKDTGTPIPGAEVTYFDSADLGPEDDVEYQRLRSDAEKLTERFGTSVFADEDGALVIPVRRTVRATGRHGELYGAITIQWKPEDADREYELELSRDLTLRVRVVDSLGKPVIGVRVGISPQWAEGSERGPSLFNLWDSEAPDGLMTMPHFQDQLPTMTRGETPVGYLLRARIPGWTEGGAPYDGGDPPADPIVVRLPPTGEVHLHAMTGGGRRAPAGVVRGVFLGGPSIEAGSNNAVGLLPGQRWSGSVGEDGVAVFEHVVAGRDYVAGARIGGASTQKLFSGPVAEGQRIDVTLSAETELYNLSGRVLDEQRVPLSRTRVRVKHVIAGGRSSNRVVTTSEDGGFEVDANIVSLDEDPRVVQLSVEDAPTGLAANQTARLYTMVGERQLRPGDNDLGDLVLSEPPLVVSGRILVNGEVIDPRVFNPSVQILETLSSGRERWQSAELTVRYPGDRFEVRGVARPARHRMSVTSSSHLPVDPVEFTPGEKDLSIEVETGGSLMATLLVDDGLPTQDLSIRLTPTDNQVPQEESANPWARNQRQLPTQLSSRVTRRGEGTHGVHWDALWPGHYELEVIPRGARVPVVQIPGIEVVSGVANRDPRLDRVDLRGVLRELIVRVVDENGAPISNEAVVIIDDPRPEAELEGFAVGQSGATIVTAEPLLNLLVAAHGYRSREVAGVSTDTTVTLETYPEIILRLASGFPELGRKHTLRASVTRSARKRDPRRFGYEGRRASLDGWLRPPRTLPAFGNNGVVALPVDADGAHEVRLWLHDDDTGRSVPIGGAEPAEIDVPAAIVRPTFEVRVPEDGLRRAVEEAGRRE